MLWFLLTGLQDNPWACDCSLYEMVHFLNFQSPNIAFIEPRLKCFTPRSLAGVFFSQVELRKCQSPVVHTSVAKVKTILGSTVLLRCGTTGVPIPELSWRRADGAPLNGTGTFKLKLFFFPSVDWVSESYAIIFCGLQSVWKLMTIAISHRWKTQKKKWVQH